MVNDNPFLKVLYTGAVKDLSGYAVAARDYIRSLDAANVDVSIDAKTFEHQPSHLLENVIERNMWRMMGKSRDARLQILHLTPDNYKDYTSNNKIKIGYYAWETSKLPLSWINYINETCVETWVPCQYLADVSVASGVKIPVKVLPHAVPVFKNFTPVSKIKGLPENKLKFYSIFQWSERKNPLNLIKAYYQEFNKNDPVIFVIKTYRVGNDIRERDFIRREISKLKRLTKGVNCPPILLIEDFLTEQEILALHYYCDCYVSMARSEGFGLPTFQASSFGNPVIVPNYSAFPEYFDNQTGYLIDIHQEISVQNMRHISILYTSDMYWGDPSIESCQQHMRSVLDDWKTAKKKGLAAKEYIKKNLSYKMIGNIMKARLERINRNF